jgi:hypothetical protein
MQKKSAKFTSFSQLNQGMFPLKEEGIKPALVNIRMAHKWEKNIYRND